MSAVDPDFNSYSKFTRGEKCIFAHLIITFVAIITIIVIYFIHAAVVRHEGDDVYGISLRAPESASRATGIHQETNAYRCVGTAYVAVGGAGSATRVACGVALVGTRWSLAPARCISARARPALAHLLPYWSLHYDAVDNSGKSGVRRGVVHPQYDDDEFVNNVGLFEHSDAVAAPSCAILSKMIEREHMETGTKNDVVLVGLKLQGGVWRAGARALPAAQCARLAAPVVQRARALAGELCVHAPHAEPAPDPHTPLLGAVLFVDSRMVGIASWGDNKGEGYPYVVIEIAPFKHWLETTMSLSSVNLPY